MADDNASQISEVPGISTATCASSSCYIESTSSSELNSTPGPTPTDTGSFLPVQNATSITEDPYDPKISTDDSTETANYYSQLVSVDALTTTDQNAKANITDSDGSVTDTSVATSPSASASSTSEVFINTLLAPTDIPATGTSQQSSAGASQSIAQSMGDTLNPSAGSQTNSQISFVSIYQTMLSNGAIVTTSTHIGSVPLPTTEADGPDDGVGGQHHPPGPIEITPGRFTEFFKRPGAATGVFIVVLLVIGSLVWMCTLIRQHRRQAAADAKRKRPSYAYGTTGLTPADRENYFSYDTTHWSPQFLRSDDENILPLQLRAPEPSAFPPAIMGPEHTLVVLSASNDRPLANFLVTRRPSLREVGPSRTTSPPIPPRSPLRSSPPLYKDQSSVKVASGDLENGTGVQPSASQFSEFYSPPSTSRLPILRSDSFGRQLQLNEPSPFKPYLYATRLQTIYDAIEPSSLSTRASPLGSSDNPYRSSAYVVPSPTPSTDLSATHERLSNPFSDVESPPQKSVALPYIREVGEAVNAAVLERGISLRRNNATRDKPEQQLTPSPSSVEYSSESGSSAVLTRQETSVHGRKLGSFSTTETSVANASKEVTSPVEADLFYKPAFTFPTRTFNPPFSDVRR